MENRAIHSVRIDTACRPGPVDMRPVDSAGHIAVHTEAGIDAADPAVVDELRAEVQEAVAKSVEEGDVGEPVQIVREDTLVAIDRLVRVEANSFGMRQDAAAFVLAEDVRQEEGAGNVRDVKPLDGFARRCRKSDGIRRRGEKECRVVIWRLSFGSRDGVEEMEARRERFAFGGSCEGPQEVSMISSRS